MNEDKLDSGLGELRDRVGNLEKGLADNTEATKRIEGGVGELIELLSFAKTGVKFLTMLGRGIRQIVIWVGPFITIGAAIWALAHGRWPEIK